MTELRETSDLIQRGQAASRAGLRDEARAYLRRAVEQDPKSIDAWLELAGVEDDPAEKATCFENVLELDPDRVEAKLGLEMLQQATQLNGAPEPLARDELEEIIAQASLQLEEAVGPPPPGEVPPDDGTMYCANHSNVETMLRCNRCSKPICTRCAVQTPVGYRCKQCVGQQQAVYFSGGVADYVIGGLIALVLGAIAAFIISRLGAWFIALILGPAIGIGISELVRLAVRRRRSRYLWLAVGGGLVVGALPALLLAFGSLWSLVAMGLYLVLAVGAAVARLR